MASCWLVGSAARGWSLGVYDPDFDPERRAAARIVAFIADVTSGSPLALKPAKDAWRHHLAA
jgi:hypothetical protein